MRVIGLMSGTSADGVDAVLAQFRGNPRQPNWSLLNLISVPYPPSLSKKVVEIGQSLKLSSYEWLELAEEITEVYAHAALACDPDGTAEVVGCHGQTLWHRPPSKKKRGGSFQTLQASLLAQLLNRPVVHDFRAADLVLGGHGAPLVPLPDQALLGRLRGWRAVLNLGGIANISLIPPCMGFDKQHSVIGWDCGPANTLIDFAVQKITKGKLAFDRDGLIGASGSPDLLAIKEWLEEPFFQKSPPKSTGREQFGLVDLQCRLEKLGNLTDADLIATLTAFSAAVVAQDLDRLLLMNLVRPIELLVSGGGCRNRLLIDELMQRCRGTRVLSIEEKGIPFNAKEALSFALLAWWHLLHVPGNSPLVTGADRDAVLGVRVNPV